MHINHWRDGENGKFFHFSEDDFDKYYGKTLGNWDGKVIDVINHGSHYWRGQVIVFRGSAKEGDAHGRRDKGHEPDQFKTGDTIELARC